MLLNCGVGKDSWESLGLQGDPTSPSERKSVLNVRWKDWCWSWKSNPLATWCEELIHLKRPWYWERLRAGEEDDRGWDGWMASSTQWTRVWANSRRWWRTGKPGVLQSMGSQRVRQDWVTEQKCARCFIRQILISTWVSLMGQVSLFLFYNDRGMHQTRFQKGCTSLDVEERRSFSSQG